MTADRSFIAALADTWAATATLGASLTEADWDRDTDCPGWSVRDQLAHITGTESMLLGRPSPPPAPAAEHVHNPIGEMNEAWVVARRGLSGAEMMSEFTEVTAARLAALNAMTDAELEADSPSPIGPVPYATFMDVRIMDCWVHEQDIRRAVAQPGHLEGPAADAALTRLLGSFGYVVGKRVAPPDGTSVGLELKGRQPRRRTVEIRDGRAVAIEGDAPPTTLIVADVETFVCLATGRWTAERALAAGGVEFRGDAAIGEAVIANLATIP
jgi:uncharacterized protein (TIGR03083 family)